MKEWIAVLKADDAAACWYVHQPCKGFAEDRLTSLFGATSARLKQDRFPDGRFVHQHIFSPQTAGEQLGMSNPQSDFTGVSSP